MKRILTVGIILIFLGITIAPSINFQVVKASRQSEIKGRITTLGHRQIQHRQIPLFTSVLKSLKENKSVPSCYLVISILIFIWMLLSGFEALLEMYLSGTLQYPLLLIAYAIIYSFLIGIAWPISLPLMGVFLFLLILDFIMHWGTPYQSFFPHFQVQFLHLFEKLDVSKLLFSRLTVLRNE